METFLVKNICSLLMKNAFYSLLSYLCLGTFFLYWLIIFILVMPPGYANKTMSEKAPMFKNMFGISWKLFTPPFTYNDRLYYIVRDIERPYRADTLEVLEKIALQKQRNAPFNDEENVIDHLVNNNVSGVKRTVWFNKKMPSQDTPGTTDSLYIAHAIAAVAATNNYTAFVTTLNNYCRVILKENNIDTIGKEFKIIITEKKIPPFKHIGDPSFLQKETLVFETPYKPFY